MWNWNVSVPDHCLFIYFGKELFFPIWAVGAIWSLIVSAHYLIPLGQSDAMSDWYSGGRGFDPRSGHICLVEILSRNNFYSHSLPPADSSRAVTGEIMGTYM